VTSKFYITTPIYYVNSTPHLGHAYTTIFADAMRRYHQLTGKETYLLTGTDEHGDKIAKKAASLNMTPKEMVDKNSEVFRNLAPKLASTNDDFIRTTDERHIKVVQALLQKVYDKGDIYFAEYEGKYCFGCERFLGDDELVDGKCPDHKTEPETIKEGNYFFKMSKYWDELRQKIEDNPRWVQPDNFRNEVIGLLKQGAQDLCISRPKERLTWGIELPFDNKFVTYVWFDALINYISALGCPDGELYQKFGGEMSHLIAKDILKPHCVYWPTMLLSMELPLPKEIAIHGYWLMDSGKMSKSHGNVVDPFEYIEKYGIDLLRFYLLRTMRFGRDSVFSHDEFLTTVNAELVNNIFNLYSRLVGMCRKNTDLKIPAYGPQGEKEQELKHAFSSLKRELEDICLSFQSDRYIERIVQASGAINKYLDESKPWSLAKDPTKKEEMGTILRLSLEAVRQVFVWLSPVIPNLSQKVLAELGADGKDLYAQLDSWEILENEQALPEKITAVPRLME